MSACRKQREVLSWEMAGMIFVDRNVRDWLKLDGAIARYNIP
jgi:hypothetical protein